MTRHAAIRLAAGLALAACVPPARAELISNGGFETGNVNGWTLQGTSQVATGAAGSTFVHAGTHGISLGEGDLSQPVATTPGSVYSVSFYLHTLPGGGDPGLFDVFWNNFDTMGNQALGQVKLLDHFSSPQLFPTTGWVRYAYLVTALGNVGALEFNYQTQAVTYPNNIALDDASVFRTPRFQVLPNPPIVSVPIGDPEPLLPLRAPFLLSASVRPVPESAAYGLAALGLAALAAGRRLRVLIVRSAGG